MKNGAVSPRPARLALAALATVALGWAGWRALALGMAGYDAASAPAEALDWRPGFAEAELNRAEAAFFGKTAPLGQDQAVRAAIRLAPLDGRGYRLLGREAELRGDLAAATRLYGIAASRAPRDLPSQAWLAERELAHGEFAPALARFDQMMRVQPEIGLKLTPLLLAVAAHAPAQADFARLLARQPPWRVDFMPRLMVQTKDLSTIFELVERLRAAPGSLAPEELRIWLDRLALEAQWGTAYLTWVQSLGPEASGRIGNVFNGSFESEPSNLGFDWRFAPVNGASISRSQVPGADESLALRVEFGGGRVPFQNVRQLLALAPGNYRLRGRVRLDDLRSERGLVWTLTCFEDGHQIGETDPMSGRREWRSFEVAATVPAEKCGGQWLTLRVPARIAAEQRIGGVAWFDDLKMKAE